MFCPVPLKHSSGSKRVFCQAAFKVRTADDLATTLMTSGAGRVAENATHALPSTKLFQIRTATLGMPSTPNRTLESAPSLFSFADL